MDKRVARLRAMIRQATKERADVCLAHLEAHKCSLPYGTYLIMRDFLIACRNRLPTDRTVVHWAENSRRRRQKGKVS